MDVVYEQQCTTSRWILKTSCRDLVGWIQCTSSWELLVLKW